MKYRWWRRATLRWLAALVTIGAAMLAVPAMTSVASASTSAPRSGTQIAQGTVTVCKVANDPTIQGKQFPFIEGTWSGSYFNGPFSLTASASPGGCQTTSKTFPVGTAFAVEEASAPLQIPSGVNASFGLTGGKLELVIPSINFVIFTIAAGNNVLTVTNTPVTPPNPGTLEICKVPGDNFVNGNFNFDISGSGNFSDTQSVPTNQCNEVGGGPGAVPAGAYHIAEEVAFPYALSDVTASPPNALTGTNIPGQTADVTVAPGGTTTVFFTNQTLTGEVKVCKNLARSLDNVLAGHTFDYTVSASFQGAPVTRIPTSISVTAGNFGTTTCSILGGTLHPTQLPLGTKVTVTEKSFDGNPLPTSVRPVATSINPSSLDAGTTPGQAVFYVGNVPPPNNAGNLGAGSVTQATFTNEAFGNLEICKTSSSLDNGTPVSFSVGGFGSLVVPVGGCSQVTIVLPVGTTTVTETPPAHTTLTSVTATGGVMWSGGNSATVTVPFGGTNPIANENVVTFDNEVNTAQFKVCKQADSSAGTYLNGKTFHFTWTYTVTVNGMARTVSGTISPDLTPGGACSGNISGVAVINGNGTPVKVTVTEGTTTVPQVVLNSVVVAGGGTLDSGSSTPLPHVVSTPGGSAANAAFANGEGQTIVTFINGRTSLIWVGD